MFGLFKRRAYPQYKERPYIDDPVGRMALQRGGIPLTGWAGATGIPVWGTLNALNPAGYIPENSQVITSPYGRGVMPNYPPELYALQVQTSTPTPNSGGSI